MRRLIVHSYRGGSGKTLLVTNIGKILSDLGKKVLLVETDFSMPSFKEIYPEYNPDIFLNDYLNDDKIKLKNCIYPDPESDFGLIFADKKFKGTDKIHSSDLTWFNEQRERMRKDLAKLDYEFVIFDSAPGVHLFTINTLSITTDIFLIIRPDSHSLKGSQQMLDQVYKRATRMKTTNVTLVFNQIPQYDKMTSELESWKTRFRNRNEFIGKVVEIPYEPETSYHSAVDKIRLPNNDPTSQEIRDMVTNSFNL